MGRRPFFRTKKEEVLQTGEYGRGMTETYFLSVLSFFATPDV